MRQLTAYASYLDNIGAPLVGRARFYNLDGEPSVVYARDNATNQFIPNGTSVFTNSSGQLEPQVFLDDHDYLIVFDKYIGHGTMSEDDEQESWDEQGSAVDKYNTIGVTLTADGCRAVSTMAELKQTVALSDPEVILLLGYNAAGDAPAVYYRWDSTETDPDDGGSVVAVQGVQRGRWVMDQCPRYLDVRNFGAFPLSASAADTAQRYAIQNAGAYARRNGCGLYFPVTDTAIYYDISGLTLYDVDSATTARVFCVDGLSASIDGIVNVRCGGSTNGSITLVNPTVYSRWEGTYANCTLAPTERLVLDSQLNERPRAWQGIKVDIERFTGGLTFNGCDITSFKKITGAVTIANSTIKTEWFADNYNWANLTIQGCTILVQNCKDATTYVTLKNKQQEPDYGDLAEGTVKDVSLLPDCIVENGTFDNVELVGSTELHNISGTVWSTQGSLTTSLKLNAVDCWLTFTQAAANVNNLILRRGALEGSHITVVNGSLYLDNVDIKCPITASLAETMVVNSRVIMPMLVANSTFLRNDISSIINQTDKDGIVSVNMDYNRFLAGGYHNIVPTTQNSLVIGHWVGNDGLGTDMPIIIDRTYLVADDYSHSYVYKGNTGSFLRDSAGPKAVTLTVRPVGLMDTNAPQYISQLAPLTLVKPKSLDSDMGQTSAGVYNWAGTYFDTASFFRVGTSGFRVYLTIEPRLAAANGLVFAVRQILETEFVSGYTFKLKTPLKSTTWPGYLELFNYPAKYATVALYGLTTGGESDYSLSAELTYDVIDRRL